MQPLPLSLSLTGLTGHNALAPGGPREQIVEASNLGYHAVQLDVSVDGLRPRQLDRSGRRDLAAILRRGSLALSGLDLFIPASHFRDVAHADRAVAAVEQALGLAADLAALAGGRGPPVSLFLPGDLAIGTLNHLAAESIARGTPIADHTWPVRIPRPDGVGVGIDPPTLIASGAVLMTAISTLPGVPVSARLSDLSPLGRVAPGRGTLHRLEYEAALVTRGYSGPLVLDLRELKDAPAIAREFAAL